MSNRILVVDDYGYCAPRSAAHFAHPPWSGKWSGKPKMALTPIAKTQALDPDLVILDISMPRKDGLEVLAELTEMKMRWRILVLSLRDSKELAAYGREQERPAT